MLLKFAESPELMMNGVNYNEFAIGAFLASAFSI